MPVVPRSVAAPRSSTWRPTWAAWGSSRTTRPLCMLSVLINTHLLQAAPRAGGRSLLLRLVRVRVRRRQAASTRTVTPLREAGRLSGHARGRLRLGEAVQRADVPPLPRGLRAGDAGRSLSQRLRPARHLGRRPREGAGRDLPQGRDAPRSPATTRSRSGATASRREASCTSTTASRARGESSTADVVEPLNLGSSELVTINGLVDIVEDDRRHRGRPPVQPRRAQGRQRPQQRQHPDPGALRLGARDQPARRPRAHLRAGCTGRSSRRSLAAPPSASPNPPRRRRGEALERALEVGDEGALGELPLGERACSLTPAPPLFGLGADRSPRRAAAPRASSCRRPSPPRTRATSRATSPPGLTAASTGSP